MWGLVTSSERQRKQRQTAGNRLLMKPVGRDSFGGSFRARGRGRFWLGQYPTWYLFTQMFPSIKNIHTQPVSCSIKTDSPDSCFMTFKCVKASPGCQKGKVYRKPLSCSCSWSKSSNQNVGFRYCLMWTINVTRSKQQDSWPRAWSLPLSANAHAP